MPETDLTAQFVFTLAKPSTRTVTLTWETRDGTAVEDIDYVPASGQLVFMPGEVTKTVTIQVLQPPTEERKFFTVAITGAVNATVDETEPGQVVIMPNNVFRGARGYKGDRGQRGRSAYEEAVNNGSFTGTYDEWLAYLRVALADLADPAPNKNASLVAIKQSGANAVVRTLRDRALETLSVRDYIATAVDGVTSNQAGIIAAIVAARAEGKDIYWPAGTYVSDANIPNFHTVRHFGRGVLKRGTDTFKMDQKGGQLNTIYVATTGLDTNDGLTANLPMQTIFTAADTVLNKWSDNLTLGSWKLQLAAGIYRRATVLCNIYNAQRLQVCGPAAAWGNPTATIDNVDLEDSVIGLYLNGLARLHVQDIKFTNFVGTNGQGLLASQSADLYTVNVHADNCGWAGINMSPGGVIRVSGGKVTNCREGIRTYSGVTFTIGYNSQDNPTIIQNCTLAGFTAHNASNGHIDYAEISGCAVGAYMSNHSRIDFAGAKLMGNNLAISADTFSTYIKNTPEDVLFNSGVPNVANERCRGGSIPNAFIANFTFSPSTRQSISGAGWSGTTAPSTYKHVLEQQAGDSGMILLANGSDLSSVAFGRAGNTAAGRLTYDHSVDWFRLIAANAIAYYATPAAFRPATDGDKTNGAISARWSVMYAVTGTINTSDEDFKQQIRPIDDACLDAFEAVEYDQYKFNDAVALKGDDARWHFGLIAQRVKEAFEARGLNAFEYGLLCYDEWEEKLPVREVRRLGDARIQNIDGTLGDVIYKDVEEEMYLQPESDNGEVLRWDFTHEVTITLDPGHPAGNRYGIRYEEALALEAALMRRTTKQLKQRLDALEGAQG